MTQGQNPRYKGLDSFKDLEIDRRAFSGRQMESRSLLSLVLAERLVVVFGKSGMGKTSLINAGVAESLRQRGYFPMTVRLSDQKHGPLRAVFEGARLAARAAGVELTDGGETSAWHFFKTLEVWSDTEDLLRPVLIIDQFEEIFTLHSPTARQELISHLAELVRGRTVGSRGGNDLGSGLDMGPPDLKIVLALREDSLADLEELAHDIPTILHHRFRLGPLDREAAHKAIVEPAGLEGTTFDTLPFFYRDDAVELILTFLAKRRHGTETVRSNEIDPAQLQLICQYLEGLVRSRQGNTKNPRLVEITTADIGGEEHLKQVLEGFYDRTLASISSPWQRRAVRRLCERRLISADGRRLPEDGKEIEQQLKISGELLARLVDARLLRPEPRLGGTFYELSHDTMIEPILRSRKKRIRQARWLWVGIGLFFLLHLGTWWVASGQRKYVAKQEAAVFAQLAMPLPDRGDPNAFLIPARARLSQVEENYFEWISSRKLYGAMAFALKEVGHRYPEVTADVNTLLAKITTAFNNESRLEKPSLAEIGKSNSPVEIKGGTFFMGSPDGFFGERDERPLHEVTVSTFWIQQHEVTNAEYWRFDRLHNPLAPADHPAVDVTWYEAMAYAAWLGGRLPTEAEWEYAARANRLYQYCDSQGQETTLKEMGWHNATADDLLQPVRQLKPNPWGLYDMHGNAWEWALDWYGPYSTDEQVDPWGPLSGEKRVIRGGSYLGNEDWACSAHRSKWKPEDTDNDQGFRVVFTTDPSKQP